MSDLNQFDRYILGDDGPAALVIREYLMPVEGPDGAVFPPTFAAGDGFPGGYNIDVFPEELEVSEAAAVLLRDGKLKAPSDLFPKSSNVCLIDSVGSQANRIEPIFATEGYRGLVPQVRIKAGEKEIYLLEAGHRAGDAIVRCSELQPILQSAFKAVLNGNAEPLARIAPTSLVFGVWDSRDTQAKLPRLVASTIRAFNVRKLSRGAVYTPPADYASLEVFSQEEKAKAEGDKKNPLAQRGFVHVPASGSHGGVIADGGIRRDATLGLAALRLLRAGEDGAKTEALRRYILGLALTAFTSNPSGYLRQGCLLVLDPSRPGERVEVAPDGSRSPFSTTHEQALSYAMAAAEAFGVGEGRIVDFEKERAVKDVKGEGDTKTKIKRGGKKAEPSEGK